MAGGAQPGSSWEVHEITRLVIDYSQSASEGLERPDGVGSGGVGVELFHLHPHQTVLQEASEPEVTPGGIQGPFNSSSAAFRVCVFGWKNEIVLLFVETSKG